MMRTLTIVLLLTIAQYTGAQTLQAYDDFEGNGNITSWFGDACNINTAFSNPHVQGINTSATVLKYEDVGGQYANARFDVSTNFDLSTNYIFNLKIYVPSSGITGNQANQVSLKLQDGSINDPWMTQSEIIIPITPDQWQLVSFDFKDGSYINLDPTSLPPTQRTDFNRVVIQVNGENNTDQVTAYIDDVILDTAVITPVIFDYLVWSDECNGSGIIDTSKWFHQTQLPPFGSWFNGEIQHYTDRVDNSVQQNGSMSIIAKKETFTDQGHTKNYTSARLNSKFAFTYGRVEVRAKLPTGGGTWPAIWLLGQNIDEDGAYWDNLGYGTTPWPACGEMDVMEHWGWNQNYVSSATHTPSSFGATINHGGQVIPTASSDYHVYAMDWTDEKLVFSVDSVVHFVYNPPIKNAQTWPFDANQYILLNVAMEGNTDPNFLVDSMNIDYIRIYQEQPSNISLPENQSNHIRSYPNPFSDRIVLDWNGSMPESVMINMYHINGQRVKHFTQRVESERVLIEGLEYLPKGIYLLEYTINGDSHTLKLVK